MSLFAHMGLGGIALTLLIAFVIKYFAVEYLLRSTYAESAVAGKGWAGMLNITSGLHAVLTFLILVLFTGLEGAIILAVIAGVVEYLLGYYRSQHRIPQVTTQKLLQAYNWASLWQNLSYGGIIAAAFKFFIAAKTGG